MKTQQAVQLYLQDAKDRQLSPRTQQSYAETLAQFVDFVGSETDVQAVGVERLRAYVRHLQDTRTPGGVAFVYRTVRAFLLWYEGEDEKYTSPTHKVKAPKPPKDKLDPVRPEEVRALLTTCDNSFLGTRDRALLLLLFDTGVRIRALLAVRREDVDLTQATVTVVSKGSKERTLFLGQKARLALSAHMAKLRRTKYVFTGNAYSSESMSYNAFRLMLARRSKDAGISGIKAHGFRRGYAVAMLKQGVDVFTLSKLMGHTDTRTLDRYIKLIEDDVAQAQRLYAPSDTAL